MKDLLMPWQQTADLLSGWEWIIILLAVVVILIWGPSKIPELAKGLGRARGEFDRASKEFAQGPPPEPEKKTNVSNDDMVLVIAKGLGISTEGKSKDQIFQEIIQNIKAPGKHS